MRYLVTGITGFAGPHLAKKLLDNGHEVFGLIRHANGREMDLLDVLSPAELSKIQWRFGDLTDEVSVQSLMQWTKVDGIFHLAAQSHPPTSFKYPVQTFKDNVMGTINLIEAMRLHQPDCIFHFCSTSEVYGNTCKDVGVLIEESTILPSNPYGASKAAIDLYMQERIRNGYIKGFVTRAFSHTGPRRGYNFSISSDACQIAKIMLNKQEPILLVGNLSTRRVVMDVRDCVDAYYRLMTNKCSGVYNVCGSDLRPMQYFTDELCKMSGVNSIEQRVHQPFWRPVDIAVQVADTQKLRMATGWKETIPIETTLHDLLYYWVEKIGEGKDDR